MINLITEKQKVQAIVKCDISQTLDDHGIYYTIVRPTKLTTREELQLSLLFSPRRTIGKSITATTFHISTSYH